MEKLSIEQTRRLALGAQGFAGSPPAGRIDRRHVRSVMQRLELLQLDSIPVVIRTQYMPLFSRLGVYPAGLLDRVAYEDDAWFEAWAHEASLVPVESEPLFRWHKERSSEGATWKSLAQLARTEPAYIQDVLDQITQRGPLLAKELSDQRPLEGEGWGSRSVGQLALNWLFRVGAVGIRRVGNFEKSFDLLERIVPAEVLAQPTPEPADALRELLARSGRALGVGTAEDLVDYFRLPVGEAKALLPDLVEAGELIQVEVQGWSKPAFRHPDVAMPRSISRAALISPFDPVVWHRERAARLFDFDYRIEIYVPEAKRRYGYYVLPLLVGDRVAARFDLKTLRNEKVLHVKGSFAEGWVDTAEVAPRAHAALRQLGAFVGTEDLRIEKRGNLAPALLSVSES